MSSIMVNRQMIIPRIRPDSLAMTDIFKLQLPLSENDVRSLPLDAKVLLTGTIYTCRDAGHKYLAAREPEQVPSPDLRGTVLYHCGPVVIRENNEWKITAAGPTTSSRENAYMPDIIRKYHIRAIIGKGGMGPETAEACRQFGCVYLQAIGGAAQILAQAIVKTVQPFFLEEFGSPEAIWQLEVKDFPAIVTMDAQGNSLHQKVAETSREKLNALLNG